MWRLKRFEDQFDEIKIMTDTIWWCDLNDILSKLLETNTDYGIINKKYSVMIPCYDFCIKFDYEPANESYIWK